VSPPRDPHALTQFPPHTRLSAPEFDAACAQAYVRALRALADDGVPHLLGGALAFNAYTGIWRDTKDLDVFLRPDDAPRALAALERAGFETEVVYESWLGKAWLGEVFVDLIWRNANGLFPVTGAWFENARRRFVLGDEALVLPPEELLLSKMMVGGRYRFDGADVLHVIHAAYDEIDWERLGEAAGEHVGLLLAYMHMYRWGYPGWRDRVPDEAMASFERRAREQGAKSRFGGFRALLLDIQSYRVDVEGWGYEDPHKKVLRDIFGDAEGRS
jgi:hypothetical protein